jgi:hypothetical protein
MFLVLLLEFFYPSESIFWRPPLSLYYNLCIEAENYTTPYLSSPLCSRTSIVFVDYIFQLPKGESAPLSFLFDYVSPFFFNEWRPYTTRKVGGPLHLGAFRILPFVARRVEWVFLGLLFFRFRLSQINKSPESRRRSLECTR